MWLDRIMKDGRTKLRFSKYMEEREGEKQSVRWKDQIDKLLEHKLFYRIAHDRREYKSLGVAFAQRSGRLHEL